MSGPSAKPDSVKGGVIHYSGAESRPLTVAAVGSWLEAIHRDWLGSRGYSIGYNWAVDWLGGVWEIRGVSLRNAANLGRLVGRDANHWTWSVLLITAGTEEATDLAVESTRALLKWLSTQSYATWQPRPWSHSDLDPTPCAGSGIRSQITAGLFDLGRDDDKERGTDMVILDWKQPGHPGWTAMMSDGVSLAWVADGYADAVYRRAGVPRADIRTLEELVGVVSSCQTTTISPPTLPLDAKVAWEQNRAATKSDIEAVLARLKGT